MAKQDFMKTKSLDAFYMRKSMKASTQERVPSGGDGREPQRPDLRHIYWNGATEIFNHGVMFTPICHLKNITYRFLIQRNNPLKNSFYKHLF